ncbi:MAG: hypothetical protein JNJ57_00900 [Saprospiraceae bacterium]|nr:hypothetical protein [Saprospiraceae bacterium]
MKKTCTGISIFLWAILTIQAQTNIPKPTYTLTKTAISSDSSLENSLELFSYYNSEGHLFEEKENGWNGTDWDLAARIYYTLNPAGKPLEQLRMRWDDVNASLVNQRRNTYEYHANGEWNYRRIDVWNSGLSNWRKSNERFIEFTATNKTLSERLDIFGLNGTQTGGFFDHFTYDGMDRVIENIYQDWNGSEWINYQKITYNYSGSSENYDHAFVQDWDVAQGVWGAPSQKLTLTLAPNEQTITYEDIINGILSPNFRIKILNNDDDQTISQTTQEFNAALNDWETTLKLEYTYNQDKSLETFKIFNTDFGSGILYLNSLSTYGYTNFPVPVHTPISNLDARVFPSLTTDKVYVSLSDTGGKAYVALLDSQGKLIRQINTVDPYVEFSLQQQPTGAYFIQIVQGGLMKTFAVQRQ